MKSFFRTGSYFGKVWLKRPVSYSSKDLYPSTIQCIWSPFAPIFSPIGQVSFSFIAPYSSIWKELHHLSPSGLLHIKKGVRWLYHIQSESPSLAPPPYDTNCRNTLSGSPQEKQCWVNALQNFTEKHGMNFGIKPSFWKKDMKLSIHLMPYYMRTLISNRTRITNDFIRVRVSPLFWRWIFHPIWHSLWPIGWSIPTVWRTLASMQCILQANLIVILNISCHTEKRPQITAAHAQGNNDFCGFTSSGSGSSCSIRTKQSPLEFIIYMATCLSFWFGWCPLQAHKINPFQYVKAARTKQTKRSMKAAGMVNERWSHVRTTLVERDSKMHIHSDLRRQDLVNIDRNGTRKPVSCRTAPHGSTLSGFLNMCGKSPQKRNHYFFLFLKSK